MRLNVDPGLPNNPQLTQDWLETLRWKLSDRLTQITKQLNLLTEGHVVAVTNAYTAAPTTGTWKQGDFIRHSAPAEAGAATAKYVIIGYICTVSGTPGTWLQCRVLTGN
jgi:ribulose bisphosphate carboxylase small subunit